VAFPAGTRRLEFQYAALSFAAPEKNRFQRFLEGRDQDWEWVRGEDSLVWDAPQPGRYRLRIRACNNDGVWNETGAQLAFVVQRFFWQTWWFQGGVWLAFAALIGGTTYGFTYGRLRRQRQRLEQELRFRSVFNSTFQLMGLLSVDGKLLEANNTSLQVIGASLPDVVGRPFWETPWWTHSPELQTRLQEAIRQAAAGASVHFEATHPKPDGNLMRIDFSLTPIRDKRGRVIFLVPEGRDITEIKQAEDKVHQLNVQLEQRVVERTAQLKDANRELEAFCYSVSHDLRTPLRAINGFSAILDEDCGTQMDEHARGCLRRIVDSTRLMERLIDDLLSLSRMTQVTLQRKQVDLGSLAESVIDRLRTADPQRIVDVVLAPNINAWADEGLMGVLLENLLGNAWKYTGPKEHPRIEFGCQIQGPDTVYFVKDNGVGFKMEHSGRLFRPFERLHADQGFPGTGIGLATVHRIVHRHGGRIWAEGSQATGATFFFSLPAQT
jgi:PAS domain S-box-containing protein